MKKLGWVLIMCMLLSVAGVAIAEETDTDTQTDMIEEWVVVVFTDAGDAQKNLITGEVVEFVSEFNGQQAWLESIRLSLDTGEELLIDPDIVGIYLVESYVSWEYVYSSEHSSVVSDIIIGDAILTLRNDVGEQCKFTLGSTICLLPDEESGYVLVYAQCAVVEDKTEEDEMEEEAAEEEEAIEEAAEETNE